MRYCIAEDSRIGGRPYNQDRLGYRHTGSALVMVLADGLGGYPRGEVAAQAVVDHLLAQFERSARPKLEAPEEFLLQGLGGSHLAILERSAELGLRQVPRTTVVACVVQEGRAYWSHVGDSRLYLLRGERVAARTRDHTRVQQLVDAGHLREEALASHPERNLLLQCLGGDRAPRLEPVSAAVLAVDDVILLCSDGLWGPLSPQRLAAALPADASRLSGALARLGELAEASAGRDCDNVSALAMLWQGEDSATPRAPSPRRGPAKPVATFPRVSAAEIRRVAAAIGSAAKGRSRNR